jgi:ribosomal protein S16
MVGPTKAYDPQLAYLFGSDARVRTLAVLANSRSPMTGYRIAKVGSFSPTKAYAELRRLGSAGLIRKEGNGWVLLDDDVRLLLQKKVRWTWLDAWDRDRIGWEQETPRLLSESLSSSREARARNPYFLRPRGYRPTRDARKVVEELRRPPSKDRLLRRRGLRTSEREDWAREG